MKTNPLQFLPLCFLSIILACGLNADTGKPSSRNLELKPVGIVSALGLEIDYLKSKLTDVQVKTIMNRDYFTGKLRGHDVIVAQIGIGAINAAAGTALLIYEFKPKAVIMTGVAGGADKPEPGDIIIADKVTFYDMGSLNAKGEFSRIAPFAPNSEFSGSGIIHYPFFFEADKRLLDIAIKASKLADFKVLEYKNEKYKPKPIQGTIASTQIFTECPKRIKEIMAETGSIAFDMECSAVAQVCYNQKIPFLTIKSISDNGDFNMFAALQKDAAINSEILVLELISYLNQGNAKPN